MKFHSNIVVGITLTIFVFWLNNHINHNTKLQFIFGEDSGRDNTERNDIVEANSSVVEQTIQIF